MIKIYQKLLKYVPNQKYLVYIAIFFTFISAILTVTAYYYIYEFLNRFIVLNDITASKHYAYLIFNIFIASSLMYIAAVSVAHLLAFRLESNLRKKGVDGLTYSSFRFFDINSSGKIRKIIDDNAKQTHSVVAHLIPDNAGAIFIPLLSLALGFVIDIKVGISLVILTIFAMILLMGMVGNQNFMKQYQKSLEELSGQTVEYIRGMQVIKIFGADVKSFKSLYEAITKYSKYALNYSMSLKIPFVLFQTLFLGFITIIIPLVILFYDFKTASEQVAVNMIMTLFLSAVLFVSFMKIMYVSTNSFLGVSAVEKIEKIFNEMRYDKLNFGEKNKFKNFNIEFEDVSFAYNDNKVLENLSFSLKQGKTYALIGKSGSGKSTIAKLISGFYKVDNGKVKIGDESIDSYSEESIMKNIAFVFQDAKLFKMSIYDNVKLANPEADRKEVLKALSLAGCDDIINKFKDKENTVIGSKGVFLSGGEKQRISIARAILKNANIIILDEAGAAVDPENEHELQKAFANLMKGKTVLMIAHRLSSIRNVDEILFIENGKIVERGSDSYLMSSDTRYKKLQNMYDSANKWRLNYENII